MSQHIGIQIANERIEVIEITDMNFALIRNITEEAALTNSNLFLNQIDPYGITIYNYSQAIKLKSNLETLLKSSPLTDEAHATADKVIEYINKLENYQFMKFIGD